MRLENKSTFTAEDFFLAEDFLAEDFLAEDFLVDDFLVEDFAPDCHPLSICSSPSFLASGWILP